MTQSDASANVNPPRGCVDRTETRFGHVPVPVPECAPRMGSTNPPLLAASAGDATGSQAARSKLCLDWTV